MDNHELTHQLMDLIGHAIDGNTDQAASLLQHIGQNTDAHQMYGVCCGLAEVGKAALTKVYGGHAPDPARGGMWAMTELQPGAATDDPARGFSMRFLVAYANGDRETALALYNAAYAAPDDQYVASVSALVATVASITRLATDEPRADR